MSKWRYVAGVELIAVGLGAIISPMVGYIIGGLGLLCFAPEVLAWLSVRTRPIRAHDFETLLSAGQQLIAEGESNVQDQRGWKARVILWDQDVRKLLLEETPPNELAMYKHIGQQPAIDQDLSLFLTFIKNRHNKLRLIFGRYLGG